MAKVGDRVAKVVCKLCGSQHNYRGDKNTPAATASAGGASTGWSRPRKRKAKGSEEVAIPTPVFDPNKPPRGYSPKDSYAVGERVAHATFGTGVVAATPGPGKVSVHFPSGERTLACAKTVAHLERPVAVSLTGVSDSPRGK
jgi:hypothetical protein